MVIDPNEAFVFHVLPDDSSASAVWCAMRVPDDHVAVCTNAFIIRHVDLNDTQAFLYSSNMLEVAQRNGLWIPGQPLDFAQVFGLGEAGHKYSSGRRMWAVFSQFAPSLNLSSTYDLSYAEKPPYPASVPSEKKGIRHFRMAIKSLKD